VGGAAEISKKAGIRVRSSIDDIGDLAPFDAITMWHTLEHFRDPRSIVARVHDSLAEGGTFIVAVPNAQGLQAKVFRENWFHLDVPRHLYHFDEGSLGALLETSGLRVLNWQHLEIEIDLFGWVQSALNAALPHQPNALFQSLTGKPRTTGLGPLALSYVLGSVLGPLALAGTALGALTGRGATITAVAERV
jgi:SAM-dependent methyltransferase